jgi:hypothetical protein
MRSPASSRTRASSHAGVKYLRPASTISPRSRQRGTSRTTPRGAVAREPSSAISVRPP